MIATVEDLRQAKEIAEEVRQDVGADPLEIGIMIEVPSAVVMPTFWPRKWISSPLAPMI
jgi:phosphocarrier protein FPr